MPLFAQIVEHLACTWSRCQCWCLMDTESSLRGLFRHWAQMYATLTIAAWLQGNLVLTSCRKDPTHGDTVHVKDIRGRTLGKKGEGKYPAPRLREQRNPGQPGWSMLLTWKMHYFWGVLRPIRGLHVQQSSGLKQAWWGTWLPVKGVIWAGVVSPLPAPNPWTC